MHGKDKYRFLLRVLLMWIMMGAPLPWGKLRGGLSREWLGYFIDYGLYHLGISISRSLWLIEWADSLIRDKLVLFRRVACGLGRLGFASGGPFPGSSRSWLRSLHDLRRFLVALSFFFQRSAAGSFSG